MLEEYIQALIDAHTRNMNSEVPPHMKKAIENKIYELESILDFYNKKCKENINRNFKINDIPTCDLVNELKTREGVKAHEIAPYEEQYTILCKPNDDIISKVLSSNDGGAIILEVID